MTTTTTQLLPRYLDVTPLAIASFLARYRGPTLTAYRTSRRSSPGASSMTWRSCG